MIPQMSKTALSETSYFTGDIDVARGGEIIQGHSKLYLNLQIPKASLYCLLAELMSSGGMEWRELSPALKRISNLATQ